MDDNTPIASPDLWAEIIRTSHRQVAKTDLGDIRVSTVFLGLDHSLGDGPPLLFETMVFERREDGSHGGDRRMESASTWELALESHQRDIAWAREQLQ